MPSEPSNLFEKISDRTFDVGIAEQHAVTFVAGLATEGYKSTQLYIRLFTKSLHQVVHDVVLQSLPVRFNR